MINVLVNHIRCKMIIKKKKKRLIKVNTKDGKVLYLVEPGYFFNEDVFLIYSQIEDEIEYEDLKSWMMSHYFGGSEIIELKLNSTLKLLKDKNLIEYQDKNYSKSNIMVKKEVDLVDEYDFYPITQIDIIITKTCNYNCKHCFINFENDVEVSFDCDKWIDICDKLIGRGLQSVVITGGEPLTIDYLSKLIIFLTRKGVRIMLLSNGYLIDKKFIEEILPYKSLITIQISLDGSSEESHDYQRNKKGSFQKTINNIKLLTDKGFKVVLAMVVSEVNYNDIIGWKYV